MQNTAKNINWNLNVVLSSITSINNATQSNGKKTRSLEIRNYLFSIFSCLLSNNMVEICHDFFSVQYFFFGSVSNFFFNDPCCDFRFTAAKYKLLIQQKKKDIDANKFMRYKKFIFQLVSLFQFEYRIMTILRDFLLGIFGNIFAILSLSVFSHL